MEMHEDNDGMYGAVENVVGMRKDYIFGCS